MPYTTEEAVQEVVGDTSTNMTAYIDTANNLMTRAFADCDNSYTTEDFEIIERWLAGHFYCILNPKTTREIADGIEDHFEGDSNMGPGLNSTRYGQTALTLDTAGCLAKAEKKARGNVAKVTWVGTEADA